MRVFSLTQHVPPSKRSIYRYFKRTAEQGIDIILHALADHLAKYDGMGEEAEWQALKTVVSALLDAYFAAEPTVVKPPRLIDGNQLMEELNIRPSKIVGDILAAIEEAQAVGEVDSQDSALEYAKQWLAQN